MTPTILILAAVTALVSMVLVWREARRRMAARETYLAPMTLFRRELSLAGICTIASVIIWVAVVPGATRIAAGALFPVFLYIFMIAGKDERD